MKPADYTNMSEMAHEEVMYTHMVRAACCTVNLVDDHEIRSRTADSGAAFQGRSYPVVDNIGRSCVTARTLDCYDDAG